MIKRALTAGPLLALAATGAWAQSSVQLFGLVDAAYRYTTNEGPGDGTLQQLIGGGLSQSQISFRGSEDLGGGLKAFSLLEYRFALDSGSIAPGTTSAAAGPAGFFALSIVGLESSEWGRLTLGRQYNVLFDAVTYSPYSSFRFGPYINAYKPEMAFALGARQDNMVKYTLNKGPLLAALAASPDENSVLGGKSLGGMLRYNADGIAVGGGYMQINDGADRQARAYTVGASWTHGPLYLNVGWARNAFDAGFNPALINSYLGGVSIYGQAANTDHRDLLTAGFTWQFAPAWNIGAQYWRAEQTGRTANADGSADFAAVVLLYSLSRRTDLYAEADTTRFHGGMALPNGEQSRVGTMVGMRHRF